MSTISNLTAEKLAAFLVPFLFSWICFAILLVEHFCNRFNIKFQALIIRIVFVFPFVSTINFIVPFVSTEVSAWIEITSAVAEGVLLVEFFAFIVGWVWSQGGDVHEILLVSDKTQYPFRIACLKVGQPFTSGEQAIRSLHLQVSQYAVVKTVVAAIYAILIVVFHDVSRTVQRWLQVVDIISVLIALKALFVTYLVLSRTKSPETKVSYFRGLSVVAKFLLIKLLFLFIVVNNLAFNVATSVTTVNAPAWICEANLTTSASDDCAHELQSFVFLVEAALASILALLFFRSRALCFPAIFGNFENFPVTQEDKSAHSLFRRIWQLHDLNHFIYNGDILQPVTEKRDSGRNNSNHKDSLNSNSSKTKSDPTYSGPSTAQDVTLA